MSEKIVIIRTYDHGGDAGMGIADFKLGKLYWNPNLLIRQLWRVNQPSVIQFIAFDCNFLYLIAFNTLCIEVKEKTYLGACNDRRFLI